MTERRALLTDREREIVAGDADVEDSYRYQTISRVRARFARLEEDLEALEKHGDLADELREIVCRGEGGQDRREAPVEESPDETDAVDTPRREDTHTPRETPPFADADKEREPPATPAESTKTLLDEIADETIPGSGEKLTARRKAFHAVVEYLREHGRATPADFQSDVYPEHTAYYTDADDPGRSWWKNAMYPALAELAERSDAVVKPDQSGIWRYVGEAEP